MGIALDIVWQSIVDDMRQIVHVETTRRHIGCHQQLHGVLAELGHRQVTLLLRKVAVEAFRIIAIANQLVGHLLRFEFRAAENDGKDARIVIHDTFQRSILVLGIHHIIDMVHVLGTFITATHDDLLRILEEVLGNLFDFPTHRGREEQRIAVLGHTGQDGIDILRESHIEHLVSFIEHHVEHRIQLCHLAFHQVDQSAWRSHDDMHTFLQGAYLGHDIGSSIDGHHMDAFDVFGEIIQVVGNLQTEFAGWAKHDGLRLA